MNLCSIICEFVCLQSAVITPLLSRDVLISKKQQFALNLTYKYSPDASGSVTFTASKLHNVLYESCFDAQFLIVSDANKRTVGKSDAFPENISLEKGTYSIRLQVRRLFMVEGCVLVGRASCGVIAVNTGPP
jgi:hypothetical protein